VGGEGGRLSKYLEQDSIKMMTVVLAVMQLPGSVIIFLCKPHVTLFIFINKQIKTGINTRFN